MRLKSCKTTWDFFFFSIIFSGNETFKSIRSNCAADIGENETFQNFVRMSEVCFCGVMKAPPMPPHPVVCLCVGHSCSQARIKLDFRPLLSQLEAYVPSCCGGGGMRRRGEKRRRRRKNKPKQTQTGLDRGCRSVTDGARRPVKAHIDLRGLTFPKA